MSAFIEIQGLTHVYPNETGGVRALAGIDIEVQRGEFLAIVGANGSGKSTLAKHLNALLLPTEGQVRIKGLDTADRQNLWQVRQAVGMVFQNPDNQMVATLVEEDVAFGPENLGVPTAEIRRRVDTALLTVGMEEYARKAPHRLSGGQKQRVAIAGVLAMAPECVVLDEATAMLDPDGRAEVMQTLERLNRQEEITIILITHYMDEAARADRVVVMDQGRVAAEGTPREIFMRLEMLAELGLAVPQVSELVRQLREAGLPLEPDIIHVEELVEALCQSSPKT